MKQFADLKTILEIIVVFATLAEYPLLLVATVVVVWIFVFINPEDENIQG